MTTLKVQTKQHESECAQAQQAIYRLSAVMFAYPLQETQQALEEGRLQQALDDAWQASGGEPWPVFDISEDVNSLEVGYMGTFIHGRRGKPRVPLVASAYEGLVKGQTAGTFMLNVQAFYSHFGVKAAVDDEGVKDEPDHLVSMLEFCALLCHLEIEALLNEHDATPYKRAHRDFLARYLQPMLQQLRSTYARESQYGLDPNIAHLIEMLPGWVGAQQLALESQVGPSVKPTSDRISVATSNESMWD